MFKLHNWVQALVQSFTLYGGSPAGGGRTTGGGKPFNPMQQNQPFNATFDGRTPSMPQYQTMNFGGGRSPQGMPQPQGLPMQGGQFGNMNPANGLPAQQQADLAPYINPVRPIPQVQQSQVMPTQPQRDLGYGIPPPRPQVMPMQSNSFVGEGRPFNPQALQNNPYLMNFGGNRPPLGMPPSQGQPEGRPFNAQANQNIPFLLNYGANRTPTSMGLPAQQPRQFMSLIGGGKPSKPTF